MVHVSYYASIKILFDNISRDDLAILILSTPPPSPSSLIVVILFLSREAVLARLGHFVKYVYKFISRDFCVFVCLVH